MEFFNSPLKHREGNNEFPVAVFDIFNAGSILVFVEKQESADTLLKDLLKRSYPCLSLHGGISKIKYFNLKAYCELHSCKLIS